MAALKGEPVDKIPVMLHNFMVAAEEIGITMRQFREDPKLMAKAFSHAVEKYKIDGILVDLDTATLAGSLGVKIDFPEHEPALSLSGILDSYDLLKALKPVDVGSYKYVQVWLESVRLLKDYFGSEIAIRGNCDTAPFSLASMVRGTENWMTDLYISEPEKLRELLEYCTEATIQFISLMAEAGAHIVSNGDSPAGPDLISPDLYEEFAFPYEKRVVEHAHKLGLPYTLHICGDTSLILDKMLLTGADSFELDYKTDIQNAFNILHDKATFIGNIDPSGVLALGTPELVKKKTLELLNVFSKTNRFILNSGCALPSSTPEINLITFVKTARDYK
jgi:uroporphyrinogen decarboxylase